MHLCSSPHTHAASTHTHTQPAWRGIRAHQVIQDGDGEIEHAHLDRLSERSVQAEQGFGFHAVPWTHRAANARLHATTTKTQIKPEEKIKKEELPSLAARFAVLSQRTAKKSTSKKPLHLLFPNTNNHPLPFLFLFSPFFPSFSSSPRSV